MSKCVCAGGGGGARPNSAEVSGGVGGIFGRLTSFNTATSQRATGWHPLHGTGLQRGVRRHDAVGGRGGWGCTGPTGIRRLRLRQATACLKHGSRYCSLGEGGGEPVSRSDTLAPPVRQCNDAGCRAMGQPHGRPNASPAAERVASGFDTNSKPNLRREGAPHLPFLSPGVGRCARRQRGFACFLFHGKLLNTVPWATDRWRLSVNHQPLEVVG